MLLPELKDTYVFILIVIQLKFKIIVLGCIRGVIFLSCGKKKQLTIKWLLFKSEAAHIVHAFLSGNRRQLQFRTAYPDSNIGEGKNYLSKTKHDAIEKYTKSGSCKKTVVHHSNGWTITDNGRLSHDKIPLFKKKKLGKYNYLNTMTFLKRNRKMLRIDKNQIACLATDRF